MVSTVAAGIQAREIETHFIVERYHRAFDDELARIARMIREQGNGASDVAAPLSELGARLRAHNLLQEFRVFPAFEQGRRAEGALFEAWADDALRVFRAVDSLRVASRALDAHAPLARRLTRLVSEVQDHVAVEAKILAPWTGV